MAHRRSFRGRGISDSQRRKKAWITVKAEIGSSGALQAAFQTSLNMPIPATGNQIGDISEVVFGLIDVGGTTQGDEASTLPEECTILRARGSLLFPKNSIGTGTQVTDQYCFGFGVSDIRSIVNGLMPGPIVDGDWDGWMFLRQSAVSPVDSMGTVVDVKAMRKIKTGDAFFLAGQSVAGSAAIVLADNFVFDLRLLILLP